MDQYVIKRICLIVGLFTGVPMGVYIHEWGHYAACLYLGYESGGITINILESSHTCMFNGMASGADIFVVLAAGGGLATAVFGVALAVFLLFARARGTTRLDGLVPLFILAGLIPQFINLVMEAGFNALYNDATMALGTACGIFLVIYIWYIQLQKHSSDHRWLGRIRRPLT